MNINLNNYETFFLMYIDNELSAPEKLSVESFLQEYSYLQEEMDLLKGMVLPDGEKFELDKTSLYRSGVMNENMQEAMLLHLDNELPVAAKTALLKKLEEDKALQHSWESLQKTKLDAAEMVSFPHKKILYRTETGRLITGKFARWAVAAALIGAGFFIGVAVLRQQAANKTGLSSKTTQKATNNGTATATKNKTATKESNVQPVSDSNQSQQNDPVPANNRAAENIAAVNGEQKKETKTAQQVVPIEKENFVKTPVEVMQKQKEDAPAPANALASIEEKQKIKNPEPGRINEVTASLVSSKRPDKEVAGTDLMEAVKNSYARNASLISEGDNDNRILFMDEEKVSQSKAGVFFKKLKRTVARSANIKTGNSLKIAGFEFAVK